MLGWPPLQAATATNTCSSAIRLIWSSMNAGKDGISALIFFKYNCSISQREYLQDYCPYPHIHPAYARALYITPATIFHVQDRH